MYFRYGFRGFPVAVRATFDRMRPRFRKSPPAVLRGIPAELFRGMWRLHFAATPALQKNGHKRRIGPAWSAF
ncbi:hypothetical protein ATKI12_7542 [Kitasatospora sp. Ki12]